MFNRIEQALVENNESALLIIANDPTNLPILCRFNHDLILKPIAHLA